ncbi:MAG: ribosomal protein S18-alanine N-acetyltransferase [Erysipelotrichaceae bacterium]|jgi:ribosomal-protein-alanine N-acetyltransferase|nr:ribosomal protein S18-alanine N-acetyltransferase [Erysipelotrichaceae bacterium]
MIRQANGEDLNELVEMERLLFGKGAWSKASFNYELTENPVSKIFLYQLNKQTVGYLGCWVLLPQIQITTLGVLPEFQNRGIGGKLLWHLEKLAKQLGVNEISLEVRISNRPAITLYQRHGFEILAKRRGYYQDNDEDAYLMVKEMDGE